MQQVLDDIGIDAEFLGLRPPHVEHVLLALVVTRAGTAAALAAADVGHYRLSLRDEFDEPSINL